jgi:hypothetical protein
MPSAGAPAADLAGAAYYASQSMPEPTQHAPSSAYVSMQLPPRSSSRRRVFAIVLILGLIAAAVVVVWSRHSSGTNQHAADPCITAPPVGTAPAAVAYLNAVAAATPGWEKVDRSLQQEQGITHADDVLTQLQTDTSFLNALQGIDFPPEAADDAATFTQAVQTYLDVLTNAAADPSYLAQNASEDAQVNEARAEASGRLRTDLNLPASPCTFRRP